MNAASLKLSYEKTLEFLRGLFARTQEQILKGGAVRAEQLEAEAKRDAPWTDRTGRARATLSGINTFADEDTYCIGVCGRQPYSPNLEYNYGGRYAVLRPVMYRNHSGLLEDIRDIISRQEGIG